MTEAIRPKTDVSEAVAEPSHAAHPVEAPAEASPATAVARTAKADHFAESFRLLALNVLRLLETAPNRSLLIMSGVAGEGRTLAAVHLAHALVDLTPRVILVDANGSGSEHHRPRRRHLADEERPGLQFIAAGGESPAEVAETVKRVINRAGDLGAVTVIDVPAATRSSLGFHIAPAVGGVLCVVRRRKSRGLAVPAAIREQLDLLGAPVLGVVVNEG